MVELWREMETGNISLCSATSAWMMGLDSTSGASTGKCGRAKCSLLQSLLPSVRWRFAGLPLSVLSLHSFVFLSTSSWFNASVFLLVLISPHASSTPFPLTLPETSHLILRCHKMPNTSWDTSTSFGASAVLSPSLCLFCVVYGPIHHKWHRFNMWKCQNTDEEKWCWQHTLRLKGNVQTAAHSELIWGMCLFSYYFIHLSPIYLSLFPPWHRCGHTAEGTLGQTEMTSVRWGLNPV